jgi:hypothetical protein
MRLSLNESQLVFVWLSWTGECCCRTCLWTQSVLGLGGLLWQKLNRIIGVMNNYELNILLSFMSGAVGAAGVGAIQSQWGTIPGVLSKWRGRLRVKSGGLISWRLLRGIASPDCNKETRPIQTSLLTIGQFNQKSARWKDKNKNRGWEDHAVQAPGWQGVLYRHTAPVCRHP